MDRKISLNLVEELFPDFFEIMTGGNFGAIQRGIDADRAKSAQSTAARVIGLLKTAVSLRSKMLF